MSSTVRYCIYFFLLSAIPALGYIFPSFSGKLLGGVEDKEYRNRLSIESVWDRSYQDGVSNWFSKHFLTRSLSILTYNQIQLWLFGEIPSNGISKIEIGEKDNLFTWEYLSELEPARRINGSDLKDFSVLLNQVSAELFRRQIAFIFLVSPSKARVLPEFLPKSYKDLERGESNAKRLEKLLELTGVLSIFSTDLVSELKDRVEYPVFPKGGIHWSYAASCEVAKLLFRRIESTLGQKPLELDCKEAFVEEYPNFRDSDIVRLSNIWFQNRFYDSKNYYPRLALKDGSIERSRPRVLFVGGSFTFNLIYYLDTADLVDSMSLLYYFKRLDEYPRRAENDDTFFYKPARTRPIRYEEFDWSKEVLERDVIVLEVNEANIQTFGYGFLEQLLTVLKSE